MKVERNTCAMCSVASDKYWVCGGVRGGPPFGNFSHIVPFFSLRASLCLKQNKLETE